MTNHFPPVLPVNKVGTIHVPLSDGSQVVNGIEVTYQKCSYQIDLVNENENGTIRPVSRQSGDLAYMLTTEELMQIKAILDKVRLQAEADYLP